jgi:hypothetical protein
MRRRNVITLGGTSLAVFGPGAAEDGAGDRVPQQPVGKQVLRRRLAENLRDYSAACCTGASNFSSTFGGDIGRL